MLGPSGLIQPDIICEGESEPPKKNLKDGDNIARISQNMS